MDELIQQLMQQTGVTQAQATGGAGLLLKAAQDRLGADKMAPVLAAVSGLGDLIKAAPSAGGAGGLLGGLASSFGARGLGGLAELAAGTARLGIDKDTLAKFVPIILAFVQGKGGDAVKALLQQALPGQSG